MSAPRASFGGGVGSAGCFLAYSVHAHVGRVCSAAIGPKSHHILATGGDDADKAVNVWRLGRPANIYSMEGHSSSVTCLAFDANEELLASGSEGGSLAVFDLSRGRLTRRLQGHMAGVACVSYHPFGELIVSGSSDTNVKVWDVRQKSCIQTYRGHGAAVTAVRFSPDGKWVASGGRDGRVLLWDLVTGRQLHAFRTHPGDAHDSSGGEVVDLAFNPCEFLLACATKERSIRLFDLDTFDAVAQTPSEASALKRCVFDGDGKTLVSVAAAHAKAWAWEPLANSGALEAKWGEVRAAVCSDDGQLLVAASDMSSLSVWAADLDAMERPRSTRLRKPVAVADADAGGAFAAARPPASSGGGAFAVVGQRVAAAEAARREEGCKGAAGEEAAPEELVTARGVRIVREGAAKAAPGGGGRQASVATEVGSSFREGAKADAIYESERRAAEELRAMLPKSRFAPPAEDEDALGRKVLQAAAERRRVRKELRSARGSPQGGPAPSAPDRAAEQRGKCGREAPAEAKDAPRRSIRDAAMREMRRGGRHAHGDVVATLTTRATHLRLLRHAWEGGDVRAWVRHLKTLNGDGDGVAAAAAFLASVPMRKCDGLRLDDLAAVLPALEAMVAEAAPVVWLTAAAKVLVDWTVMFGAIIGGARRLPSRGAGIGIDVAAQERQAKARVAYDGIDGLLAKLERAVRERPKARADADLVEGVAALRTQVLRL